MSKLILLVAAVLLAICGVAFARTAEASHILVPSLDRCNEIKAQIEAAPDKFEAVFHQYELRLSVVV
jgi:hypothetical protein